MEELLKKVIAKNGSLIQKIVVIEELSELQKEITKDLRDLTNKDYIAEEMADVYIVLKELELIYNNHDQVKGFIKKKLERLEDNVRNNV